jgi:cobalt-zinc-cadmium efflux system membrane fusion protein
MKHPCSSITALAVVACFAVLSSGCSNGKADPGSEAPPPAQVEQEQDGGAFRVDHPEQFSLATAGQHEAAPELNVTGTVSPDVSRNIPVVSLASGRCTRLLYRSPAGN